MQWNIQATTKTRIFEIVYGFNHIIKAANAPTILFQVGSFPCKTNRKKNRIVGNIHQFNDMSPIVTKIVDIDDLLLDFLKIIV